MQNLTISYVSTGFGESVNSLRKVVTMFAICILIGSGLTISNAGAEEQPMHDMSDMKDMPGMEHMDHSVHLQGLSKRGSYTRSVMSYMVPDVKLVDVNGKSVSLRELTDDHSAILLNFIFTTCTTICPVMTATFQQVQEKLGKNRNEVRMVSISIDPENDTPQKLKEYAAKYKAGNQWTFLTGSLDKSILVQKSFGVLAGEKMNQKPITFLKAKGSDSQWVRLEGLVEAGQIIDEYNKLGMEKMKHE